jgi:hypothetical protein
MKTGRWSIDQQWTAKQREATAIADSHRYTLFGGARGPGKSYWLRWYVLRGLLRFWAQGLRNVRAMLACEDYPSLRDRQIEKLRREFPAWLGEYAISASEFQIRERYGGGVLCLRNLDDASKYQSSEFAIIAVDELTKNPENTFNALRGSLRWTGVDRPQFVAATNPNGLGAQWVRSLWVERQFPDYLRRLAPEFAFVPGLPSDNPYLSNAYREDLHALPEALRKAWELGDWYAGVEGLVYDQFDAANITTDEPDPTLPIEIGFDDGYIDPRAILLIQRTPTRVLVFDELYQRQTLAEQSVSDVIARCVERGLPRPELAVGSPEAKELQTRFRMSDIPTRFAVHKIVQGIDVVRNLICDSHGRRVLQVHSRCRNLIQELTELYVYPEGKHQLHENPASGGDHAADALRYYCYLRVQ